MRRFTASARIFAAFSIIVCLWWTLVDGKESSSCSKVDAGEVTLCLEPMIQLSEELARKDPIINMIVFPLYNFEVQDLERICRIWTEMHATCLNGLLKARCKRHGLLKILNSLFTFSCSDDTSSLFSKHYSCLSGVVKTHQACVDRLAVPIDPTLRHKNKCDPVPGYYFCLEPSLLNNCQAEGLDVFQRTLDTFGCPQEKPTSTFVKNISSMDQKNTGILQLQKTHNELTTVSENDTLTTQAVQIVRADQDQQPEQSQLSTRNSISKNTGQNQKSLNLISESETVTSNNNQKNAISFISNRSSRNQQAILNKQQLTSANPAEDKKTITENLISIDRHQNINFISHSATTSLHVSPNDIQDVNQLLPADFSSSSGSVSREGPQPFGFDPHRHPNDVEYAVGDVIETSRHCTESSRNKARSCLQPVMQMWHQLAQKQPLLSNVTFPLFLMDKEQVLELCDLYASAFLDCDLETFRICSQDPIVEFSDAMLGYACGNAIAFFRSYDCLSVIAQDSGSLECRTKIEIGIAENFDRRCAGIKAFFMCIQETVEAICPPNSLTILKQAINYYGCYP